MVLSGSDGATETYCDFRNRSIMHTDTCSYQLIVSIITDKWMPTASFTLHYTHDDGIDGNLRRMYNNDDRDDDDDGFHELCIVFKMMRINKRC